MEQLSQLAAAFLEIEDEDRNASLAIASVAVAEGPAPDQQDFVDAISARLPMVPRYRQKIRRVPFDLSAPMWVEDENFAPRQHFFRIGLPAPGDDAALADLVALIMTERLHRDRPLWEFWVIEGLPGDRWAVLSKLHHCLADGISANALQAVLFAGTPPGPRDDEEPAPEPGTAQVLWTALGELASSPFSRLGSLGKQLLSPDRLVRRVAATARGLGSLAAALIPAAPSFLTGPIQRQRRYTLAHASLQDVREISRAFEVTVNDVVLAVISGGFRELLLDRGERPAADSVRALVPVSVRAAGDHDVVDNQISLMLPLLPVDVVDPVARLLTVHRRLAGLKADDGAGAGAAVTASAQRGPFAPIAWAVRAAAKIPQRNIVTVATNIPGPRRPLSLLGRPIVELYPYVPIALQLRVGVAVLTYCDRMAFGITSDFASVPDTAALASAIERDIATMTIAARTSIGDRAPGATRSPR
ncbi:wax ester/triacylglycerol synthase family O-acyltransferase [Amycolatopsis kentuckyensis]|uniref:wax ester/triacylglycerol synthase family O-acyltransferase n=1 Tax=Amycolatopsis kentuckyensis TaxID=218823 RepID=UPI000A3BDEF7|nr:wax ester/triacylglycerol synthase family O-acyltransferase [Amycolatopsis kentuckyensis]